VLTARPEQTVTEEEVKAVVAEGVTIGMLKPEEKEMISGIMRLADWRVEAIMTPRQEVAWLDLDGGDEAIGRSLQESHCGPGQPRSGARDRASQKPLEPSPRWAISRHRRRLVPTQHRASLYNSASCAGVV
jgi:hypothetical protein